MNEHSRFYSVLDEVSHLWLSAVHRLCVVWVFLFPAVILISRIFFSRSLSYRDAVGFMAITFLVFISFSHFYVSRVFFTFDYMAWLSICLFIPGRISKRLADRHSPA